MPVFKLGRFHLIAPPRKGRRANRAPRPIFADTLEEAAAFLAKGCQLLMGEPGAWWGTFVDANALNIALGPDEVGP